MDFKTFRDLVSVVNTHNSNKDWIPVKIMRPYVYEGEEYYCNLIFGRTLDSEEMSDILLFLYGNSCQFFIGVDDRNIAIYVY